jgi:glycosyltransferase involved in cell wall biosynthesis
MKKGRKPLFLHSFSFILDRNSLSSSFAIASCVSSAIFSIVNDLIVSDSPRDMAEKVISLLNQNKWADFSKQGRIFVEEHFCWNRSAQKLISIINKLKKV